MTLNLSDLLGLMIVAPLDLYFPKNWAPSLEIVGLESYYPGPGFFTIVVANSWTNKKI